jgi:hypothetical protein
MQKGSILEEKQEESPLRNERAQLGEIALLKGGA